MCKLTNVHKNPKTKPAVSVPMVLVDHTDGKAVKSERWPVYFLFTIQVDI